MISKNPILYFRTPDLLIEDLADFSAARPLNQVTPNVKHSQDPNASPTMITKTREAADSTEHSE